MEILLRDSDVVSLVLEFLHSRQLYDSALALEKETGYLSPKDESLPEDLKSLRQLALNGQWELLLRHMEPFMQLEDFDGRALYYHVLRQRYFESLHSISSSRRSQKDVAALKGVLEDFRRYCSREEYRQLDEERDHSDLYEWSVTASRFRCFHSILDLVGPLYEGDNVSATGAGGDNWWQHTESGHSSNSLLVSIFKCALLHKECSKYCVDRATGIGPPNAEIPHLTSANLDQWQWKALLDTSLLFWLRSLSQDELFKQHYERADVDFKIEYLKKRTQKHAATLPEPASELSSFVPVANQQRENFVRSPNMPVVTQSLQFAATDQARQHPASASMPGHSSHPRNFSNNNNNSEHTGLASVRSKTQPRPVETSPRVAHQESSGARENEASVEHSQSAIALKDEQHSSNQWTVVNDHNSNKIFENATPHPPPPAEPSNRYQDFHPAPIPGRIDQENPATIEKVAKSSDTKTLQSPQMQQNLHTGDRPLRDSSNLVNGTGDGHLGPSVQVADSYADFLEETKKLKLEKQNFLQQLESKEKKNEEIRQLLMDSPKNDIQPTMKPQAQLGAAATKDVAHDDHTKGAVDRPPPSKSVYVPIEVTEDVQAIRSVSFHPSGLVYAIGSNSKTLRVCAVPGDIVYPHSGVPNSSKDFNAGDGSILKPSKVLVKRTHIHKGSIYSLGWNEEGSLIATGSNDKLVKVHGFDVLGKTLEDSPQEMAFHRGIVREVLFIGGRGDLLASAGGDTFIFTTDCTHNKTVHKLAGHSDHVLSLFDWHHTMLASSSQDKSVRLWDLRTPRCVSIIGVGGNHPCIPTSVCVDGTNRWLAMGCDNQTVALYDLAAGKVALEYKPHDGEVRSVRFNPVKTSCLLSSSYDGTIALTDVDGLFSEIEPAASVGYHTSTIVKSKDKVIQCRWHPNGEDFASTSVDKTCKLWHRVEK